MTLSIFTKEARHALERLQERTSLPPDVIPHLEAAADRLSSQVPEGHYYLPLNGANGALVGYAAFKTVPGYPRHKLVLATILGPHMHPKGSSLSHVMPQPKLASVFDVKAPELTPYDKMIRSQFNELADIMRTQGSWAGTNHRRVIIPKDRVTEQDLGHLGFTPVTIAIPEAGQDRFRSYRHVDNNFHLHSHHNNWTMHEDNHASASMLAKRETTAGGKAKAFLNGAPHVTDEGLPGLLLYIKGQLSGRDSTADRVLMELPDEAKLRIFGLPKSPTAPVPAADPMLKAASDGVLEALYELREKMAAVTTDLKPHQQRVVDRMKDPNQKGLIAVHGLGSGKTLTSIAVADALGLPADVVVPAALQANYAKELVKHTDKPPHANIVSLENSARKGGGFLKNPLMVVDEAHRIRNPGKTRNALSMSPSEKRLLLTGSLVYNHPSDMSALVNLAAGEKVLPASPSEFEGRYIQETSKGPGFWGSLTGAPSTTSLGVNPSSREELKGILKKYVDFHPGSTEGFPERTDQVIRVPMADHQRKIDDALLEDLPPWARQKILKNLPPKRSEAQQLNAFMTAIRQNANTTQAFDTKNAPEQPKLDAAMGELRKALDANPKAKAVIYSNWIDAGITPYKAMLDQHKIPYGEFSGQMSKNQRDDLVRQYNDDKLKALLISSAGGEGLDLKGTSLLQVLEPSWNEERIKQVIGRGIRFKSHDHLAPEDRKILIQRFLTTRPRQGLLERLKMRDPGGSADEYLYNRSNEKEELNAKFRALLHQH